MSTVQPIKIAILAMGGEGGGVLADWLVDIGEANGYIAQTTSVPGVAQRTGATIYYVELYPQERAMTDGGRPVLALMPLPGDVDVVLASELMEAGRAVQRGLVTADRTTLVASTHRVYAISEKTAMGDGRSDSANLLAHAQSASKRFVKFDMAKIAEDTGSVISAVLFGALAGTGVLPFSRTQFEATILSGGVGVKTSLKAFSAGFAGVDAELRPEPVSATVSAAELARTAAPEVRTLLHRVTTQFPAAVQPVLIEGIRRLIDYQDPAYASLYLDRLSALPTSMEDESGLLSEAARHLALWMSYEDTIRVAELKTRGGRFNRVGSEVKVRDDQLLAINEFMHPRVQEICETLPASVGEWLQRSGWPRRLVERFAHKGRIIQTTSLRGFMLLYTLSRFKHWRRTTLRFKLETTRIEEWLSRVAQIARSNPQLATELAQCQRLVKGYGDTHERGLRNYATVVHAIDTAGSRITPAIVRELRDAALADERGDKLRAALVQFGLAVTRPAAGVPSAQSGGEAA